MVLRWASVCVVHVGEEHDGDPGGTVLVHEYVNSGRGEADVEHLLVVPAVRVVEPLERLAGDVGPLLRSQVLWPLVAGSLKVGDDLAGPPVRGRRVGKIAGLRHLVIPLQGQLVEVPRPVKRVGSVCLAVLVDHFDQRCTSEVVLLLDAHVVNGSRLILSGLFRWGGSGLRRLWIRLRLRCFGRVFWLIRVRSPWLRLSVWILPLAFVPLLVEVRKPVFNVCVQVSHAVLDDDPWRGRRRCRRRLVRCLLLGRSSRGFLGLLLGSPVSACRGGTCRDIGRGR